MTQSPSNLSILLQLSNSILAAAAKATQKVIFLNKNRKNKQEIIPDDPKVALAKHNSNHLNSKTRLSDNNIREDEIITQKQLNYIPSPPPLMVTCLLKISKNLFYICEF